MVNFVLYKFHFNLKTTIQNNNNNNNNDTTTTNDDDVNFRLTIRIDYDSVCKTLSTMPGIE